MLTIISCDMVSISQLYTNRGCVFNRYGFLLGEF